MSVTKSFFTTGQVVSQTDMQDFSQSLYTEIGALANSNQGSIINLYSNISITDNTIFIPSGTFSFNINVSIPQFTQYQPNSMILDCLSTTLTITGLIGYIVATYTVTPPTLSLNEYTITGNYAFSTTLDNTMVMICAINNGKILYNGNFLQPQIKKIPNMFVCNAPSKIATNSIAYNNETWVAGIGNNGLWYSYDNVNFVQSNITTGVYKQIVFNDNMFLAIAYNQYIKYSYDGKSWTDCNLASILNPYYLYYINNIWFSSSLTAGASLISSTDGINFNIVTTPFTGVNTISDITYINNLYVLDVFGSIWTSPDLITFTQRLSISTAPVNNLFYADGLLVAAGSQNIYISTDGGLTWTNILTVTGYDIISIYNANGVWFYTTDQTGISSSGIYYAIYSDGTLTFQPTNVNLSTGTKINNITYGNGVFMASSTDPLVYTWYSNNNGVSFQPVINPIHQHNHGGIYSNGINTIGNTNPQTQFGEWRGETLNDYAPPIYSTLVYFANNTWIIGLSNCMLYGYNMAIC